MRLVVGGVGVQLKGGDMELGELHGVLGLVEQEAATDRAHAAEVGTGEQLAVEVDPRLERRGAVGAAGVGCMRRGNGGGNAR